MYALNIDPTLRIALSTVLSLVLGIEYYNLKPEVGSHRSQREDDHDYMYVEKGYYAISVLGVTELALLWLIIYSYIIPISMYVTLELQRFPVSQVRTGWEGYRLHGRQGGPSCWAGLTFTSI